MEYYDIYQKRLNRYGTNYQDRIQNRREKDFLLYCERSVYRTTFEYNNNKHIGTFEPYKENETRILHYLLTNVDLNIPTGTILFLNNKDSVLIPWMVWYLEEMSASGYNRYIMIKMTHNLSWKDRSGATRQSYAYMYGQENNMLMDELMSRSRSHTIYKENLKTSFFILPRNQYIEKDDYFIIGEAPYTEYYKVTGYDRQSTPGVEYVTVDPVYEYDLSAPPEKQETDEDTDFYWLDGGTK